MKKKKYSCDICNKPFKKHHKYYALWGDIIINFGDGKKWVLWICIKCHNNLYSKCGVITDIKPILLKDGGYKVLMPISRGKP